MYIYIYIYIYTKCTCTYKQIIKTDDFKQISKDYLLARWTTLSNKQRIKIKIKLLNKSASYLVNEELIDYKL